MNPIKTLRCAVVGSEEDDRVVIYLQLLEQVDYLSQLPIHH